MIEIYSHNNTSYIANGDMTLTPSSLTGKVELNGVCEITLEHPYDLEGRWKYIKEDAIIACPTPWSGKQLFRIYNKVKDIDSVTAYARHVYFDLANYVLLDSRPTLKNGQQALDIILSGTPFTGSSNISTINTAYYIRKNVLEALASDDENSFINRWKGERYLDNYNLTINSKLGGDYGVRVEFGYNLGAIEEDINLNEVVTRIIPVGYNGIMLSGTTPWIDSKNINKYAVIKQKVITFDDVKVKEGDETEGFNTLAEAQAELVSRCNKLFEGGIDLPRINYKVNMINLANTTEYKDYKVLEDVGLGDVVHCKHGDLDIDISARCISLEWEIEEDKVRYTNVELGNFIGNYFDNQSDITSRVEKILTSNGNVNTLTLEGTIDALQNKFKAQKDIAQTQHIRAMLFEDKTVESPTYGAFCLGTMGFMIADKRTADNKDWDWRTFGTGSGFTADEINVGTLSAVLIQNLDSSFQVDLSQSGGARFYNNDTLALEMRNNELMVYNWAKNGDYVGSIGSLSSLSNPNKPSLGVWNSIGGAIQIGYKDANNNIQPYVRFDKYNVFGDAVEETQFYGDVAMEYLYTDTTYAQAFRGSNLNTLNLECDYLYGSRVGQSPVFSVDMTTQTLEIQNLSVGGNKNCIQTTANYGKVPFYANEDINSLLTKTPVDEVYKTKYYEETGNYKCIIKISDFIRECINTEENYNIWLTKLGQGDLWVANTYTGYFVVQSDKEIKFKYKLEGKRKGFEKQTEEKYLKDFKR
jgi:phage minor structural protein